MPCKITQKGELKLCNGMKEVVQYQGGRGTRSQGAELQTLINLKTGKFSRNWIVLKSGKHGKTGIVMNHCPFCGETIFKSEAA